MNTRGHTPITDRVQPGKTDTRVLRSGVGEVARASEWPWGGGPASWAKPSKQALLVKKKQTAKSNSTERRREALVRAEEISFPASARNGASAAADSYIGPVGKASSPSLQVAPVRLGTRSLPAHYPVSLRATLSVRGTVACHAIAR